jgi:DNA-nicking Smr family endonuclease
MKKNKYAQNLQIDTEIDLHGLTDYEGEEVVLDFLNNSRNSGFKVVKIITGKGIHSAGEPILKKITREILIQQNLKFSTAKAQDGGSGTLIVNLQ